MTRWWIILGLVLVSIGAGLGLAILWMQGPGPEQVASPVQFREVSTGFVHEIDLDRTLPFMGAAAIDVDGDGLDELVLGGGENQADALLRWTGSGFEPIEETGLEKPPGVATFGMAAVDATGDGRSDLFVARSDGVYFHPNLGRPRDSAGPRFGAERISFPLAKGTTPLSITLADVDHDGAVDLYVAGYVSFEEIEGETIFNRPYGGYSHLLHNEGGNRFRDVTESAGLRRRHNTFMGLFADIDDDGWADLVIAQDTGVVEIMRNRGDLTFEAIDNPTLAYSSYPMGIAAGDYDRDGRIDFYFSNVGPTLPEFMLRGDLRPDQILHTDYILLHNDGGLRFSDRARTAGVAEIGFGWGTVMTDLDNDGRQDLLVAQNYARFPGVRYLRLYGGHFLRQIESGVFAAAERSAGLENENFGISPVVADFNGDGWSDVVFANLGQPARAHISQGGEAAWLQVLLPDTPAALTARVSVTRADDVVLHDQWLSGEGLASEQSRRLQFGLGTAEGPATVRIRYGGLGERVYPDVPARTVLRAGLPIGSDAPSGGDSATADPTNGASETND